MNTATVSRSPRVFSHYDTDVVASFPLPTTVYHSYVVELLTQARKNNIREGIDLPYMPLPATNLMEAVRHLKVVGYILIQGGRLELVRATGDLLLTLLRGGRSVQVNHTEVIHLLKANYPSRVSKRRLLRAFSPKMPIYEEKVIIRDTDRCPPPMVNEIPPPTPVPSRDFAIMCVGRPLGYDIHSIFPEEWVLTTIDPDGSEKYVGMIALNNVWWHVWYNTTHRCFWSQTMLPVEETC